MYVDDTCGVRACSLAALSEHPSSNACCAAWLRLRAQGKVCPQPCCAWHGHGVGMPGGVCV
eukprot:1724781-Pyramimonas_sp.AAC.1